MKHPLGSRSHARASRSHGRASRSHGRVARSWGLESPFHARVIAPQGGAMADRPRPRRAVPLESGHVAGRTTNTKSASGGSLNPFEIRAPARRRVRRHALVLIPLKSGHVSGPKPCGRHHQAPEVLIPLKSGHVSGHPGLPDLAGVHVLIPLKSGHVSGLGSPATLSSPSSLNPFEIRACVRTVTPRSMRRAAPVLIPLKSGHVSGRRSPPRSRPSTPS